MNENQIYHADTSRVSKSGLDKIDISPFHYWSRYLDPDRQKNDIQTPAMLLGSAIHCRVFEPLEFKRRYVIAPDMERRSNVDKQKYQELLQECALNNQSLISSDQYESIQQMGSALEQHPGSRMLLDLGGESEVQVNFTEPITGAPGKIKIDRLTPDRWILDLKSANDITPGAFSRSIFDRRYHVQDAWYSDGLMHNTGQPVQGFIMIAVQSEWPYLVKPYILDPISREIGRSAYLRNAQTYVECVRTGHWPSLGNEISEISLPPFALKTL